MDGWPCRAGSTALALRPGAPEVESCSYVSSTPRRGGLGLMSLPEEILTQIAFAAARSDPQSVFTLSQTSDAFRKLLLSETVLRCGAPTPQPTSSWIPYHGQCRTEWARSGLEPSEKCDALTNRNAEPDCLLSAY